MTFWKQKIKIPSTNWNLCSLWNNCSLKGWHISETKNKSLIFWKPLSVFDLMIPRDKLLNFWPRNFCQIDMAVSCQFDQITNLNLFVSLNVQFHDFFNPFPFLCPLKASENHRFSDVSKGYRNETWIYMIFFQYLSLQPFSYYIVALHV